MVSLKLAARTLIKSPFVTIVTVLSLALGIGANAGIYSVFHEMLQTPLPVPNPDQLVNLAAPGPNPGSQSCNQAGDCNAVFSYPMFRDLEQANKDFTGIAAHRSFGAHLAFHNQTINAGGMMVSGSYFPVLDIKPAIGRLFTPDDDKTLGANFLAVLSYDYWQNQLGGSPSVLGDVIDVNGQPMTIIGVAPQGFDGTTLGSRPKVFVPITMHDQMWVNSADINRRNNYWVYLFARLKPGVSMAQATGSINATYHAIINDVEAALQKGMSDKTMARFRAKKVTVEDGRLGQSQVRGMASTPLFMLFAITGIVLLIACANIANLLLARGADRASEMAVRVSVGATRGRLVAQLLTESLMLAALGGTVSVAVAYWTLALLAAILPPDAASTFHVTLRVSTLLFAAAMSFATGILFGLFPALHSTRPDLVTSLRNATGKHSGGRAAQRFRTTLATAQITLSMTLLMSAGLFIKSLANVSRVDLGVEINNVVTFGLSPELNAYDSTRSRAFFERATEQLSALPGVTGVTAALVPLLAGSNWGNDVSVEGYKRGPDTDNNSRFNEVGPNYFHVLGVQFVAGRDFTDQDVLGAPKVAIVNEAFAKKFNLGRDAVGKHMGMGKTLDMEIVGLVKDSKYSDVKLPVPPVFAIPYRQDGTIGSLSFYVRDARDPKPLLATIPKVIARLDPNLPVEDIKTMPQQVRDNIFLDRMISSLSGGFAALATLLAAIGLYGVLAYSIAQRTREIGVRKALGADPGDIRLMVLKQVGVMTLIGGVLGLAAAIGLGRAAQSMLYQLQGHDPVVMAVAIVSLALVALAAGLIPALRASRIHPMEALRYE